MLLRFVPRGDAMPLEPFAPKGVGQPKRYIGRKLNTDTGEYELTGKPFECKSGSRAAERCLKFVRRGDCAPYQASQSKTKKVVTVDV